MKKEYIPKVITLFAGLVVCIVTIVRKMDVTYSLAALLLTLIVFYIIGLIVKAIFIKVEKSNRVVKNEIENVAEEENVQAAGNIENSENITESGL